MKYSLASFEQMAEVARVMRTTFRHTYPTFPELHSPDEDLAYFEELAFNADIYVATAGDRIQGFIAFNSEFIDHLYVLPQAQGQGIGSALLSIAVQKYFLLKVWTFQENAKARAFYQKHGFTAIEFTDGEKNEERRPDVLFRHQSTRSSA